MTAGLRRSSGTASANERRGAGGLSTVRLLRCVLATGVLVAAGCSEVAPEITTDQLVDRTRTELIDAGADAEVADCVIRLAERDLRLGPLDDLVRDELVLNCERAVGVLNGSDADADETGRTLAFSDGPNTLGDDPELDRLWRACEDGSGLACDELFEQSPVGSDYERFGVSCGERDDILECTELDDPEGE